MTYAVVVPVTPLSFENYILLAQGLGFTDAGSFEFQQGFSDDGARDQQRSAAGFGGGIDDGAGPVTAGVQHKNVVDDGQLDILT